MERLEEATPKELEQVNEVGPKLAESIHHFFQEKQNRALIKRLEDLGLKMKSDVQSDRPGRCSPARPSLSQEPWTD
jgi:NAD-dependent DNA ligase (contains BRCT domain type II)